MEKSFNPKDFEEKWARFWKEKGFFEADVNSTKPKFSMVIPPPNVTGVLHMGHALVFTLYDIIARWKRMQGYDTLWLPGTDHAGIATQVVVERKLKEEGKTKEELGREEFLKRVWEWVEESSKTINYQLEKLGCSVDWSRYKFTLSEELSRAVRHAFVQLYREGLIYRDYYMVNWCPRCHTALSDLEVEYREEQGKLYYIKYPFKDNPEDGLVVATTRPETMLGDTAVAVNPGDSRYKNAVGKTLILPIVGREIPVIEDGEVDPEFGTGAVKVTPAHDPVDFEIGKRHGLPMVIVIDDLGKMTEEAGEEFRGLDRYEAREKVVEKLKELGLLVKVEDYVHNVGHCYRCGTVIEPYPSWQWFVKTKPLASPAIKAVEEGRTRFVPENWSKLYFHWMHNIRDWCISRQIWWGHRIPAWHCRDCGHITVSEEEPAVCEKCGSSNIYQDEDVLDTWFSSALWPLSTLGWPEETPDLKRYYPTDLLITGFDIIFFWVARMMMMGLHFRGDVPFYEVFINGLIRDEHGKKMSKMAGNVVDPLVMIDKYGADALRFTLAVQTVPGMDVAFSEGRLAGYKAFANKIWNASRFVVMNYQGEPTEINPAKLSPFDRWILHRVSEVAKETNQSLEEYKFYEAAERLYHFVWHEFCDWYIEISKLQMREERENTMAVLINSLETILRLLHPFMPFITEEIWQRLPHEGESIAVAPYPRGDQWSFPEVMDDVSFFMEVVSEIRRIRSENRINPKDKIRVSVSVENDFLKENKIVLSSLVGAEEVLLGSSFGKGFKGVVKGGEVFVLPGKEVDLRAEKERVKKELKKLEKEIEKLTKRIFMPGFREKAPKEVVIKTEQALKQAEEKKAKLEEYYRSL